MIKKGSQIQYGKKFGFVVRVINDRALIKLWKKDCGFTLDEIDPRTCIASEKDVKLSEIREIEGVDSYNMATAQRVIDALLEEDPQTQISNELFGGTF